MQEIQEMWVCSLGWEDLLEKEMTTHSSLLVRETPMWATVHGVAGSDMVEPLNTAQHSSTAYPGKKTTSPYNREYKPCVDF